MEAARRFALRAIVDPYLDGLRRELQEGQSMGDHKSALQEMLQARKAGPPEYQVKAEMGPDHRKRFLVEVRVSGLEGTPEMRAEGSGSTKKRAEQEAARRAFARLREGKRGDHRGQGAED
jgi:ribonuclease-3